MKSWFFGTVVVLLAALGRGFCSESEVVSNLWAFRLPDRGAESSPAIAADGTIYQGTFHGWLVAVTPEGGLKWKFKAGREIKSSPSVAADGTICFGARDWHLYTLTPDGKLKWKFATGAWVDSSPAIAADGTVCFGSWDGNFYALNPDGSLKWKFATGGIVSGSAAIAADGTIYFGSHDKILYALTPDGKLKWKFATGAEIIASPALGADGAVYFSSTDGNLYTLNPDGTERWRLHTGGYTASSPVLDEGGNVYLGVNRERYAIAADGKVRWHFAGDNLVETSAAALTDGRIFTAAPWSPSGLMTTNGDFLWNFRVGYGFQSSANVSSHGVIHIADDQYLYAFRPLKVVAVPAKSSWPLWRANPQHTGRAGK